MARFLLYNTCQLLLLLVPLAFALMMLDALEGVAHPPIGARPAAIGLRQRFSERLVLPRESRESAVEQYRALPEEKKKELNERSRRKEAAQLVPKK